LTFSPNGGTVDVTSKTLVEDDAYGTLPVPTRAGYTFQGWYTSVIGGVKVSETTVMESQNTVVYAHWSPITYAIMYHGNGNDSGQTESSIHTYNTSKELTTNDFEKLGYHFVGWSTSETGTVEYINNATVLNLSEINGDVINLYAIWEANTYTVEYNGNNATGGIMFDSEYVYDVSQALLTNAFYRNGYTFQGWSTTPDGTVIYTDTEVVQNLTTVNNDVVTLYAVWEANEYTVKFNSNGAVTDDAESEALMPSFVITYDETKQLPKNEFTIPGYHFAGWSMARTSIVYADESEIMNLTDIDNDIVTLYAIWEENVYTVVYDGNGADSGAVSDSIHTYNVQAVLHANEFVKTGYTFIEWNTKADGSGDSYQNNELVMNLTTEHETAVTLYAIWKANEYVVTFDANGGNSSFASKAITFDGLYGELPVATKPGYEFVGWCTEHDLIVNESSIVQIPSNHTLYAKWLAPHTLTFYANGGTVTESSRVVLETKTYGTLPVPTRDGYTFKGWYTAASGGTQVTENTVMGSGNIAIYAQ